MPPVIRDRLIALVTLFESFRPTAYLCPAGYPTIGFGHRIPSLDHPPVTLEEATRWLLEDLARAQAAALQLVPSLATLPGPLDALTDLVFNVGLGALDGENPKDPLDDAGVVLAMRRGDWADARARFVRWNHLRNPVTKQLEVARGLTRRREAAARWIAA